MKSYISDKLGQKQNVAVFDGRDLSVDEKLEILRELLTENESSEITLVLFNPERVVGELAIDAAEVMM